MTSNWVQHKLGDVLYQDFDSAVSVKVEDLYPMVGVYSFGKGLFDKDVQSGFNSSYKTFYKLKAKHIVMSQLFGWEGAIALSSNKFENKFVSTQFPTFLVDEEQVDRSFIGYFLQLPTTWSKLFEVGKGMGSRRRTLNPANLLSLRILLPDIKVQNIIVKRLDTIKDKLNQINIIHQTQAGTLNILRNSIFKDLQNKCNSEPIEKILIQNQEILQIDDNYTYKQVTVRMEHKGIRLRGLQKGCDIGSKQFLAKEGQFIISKIDARNGAMGIVPKDLDGAVVTNDFPLFDFSLEVNPKYFYYFSNTYYFDNECKNASEGSTNRRRLKMNKFAKILMPYPPIEEQNRIVKILDKCSDIQSHYKNSQKELNKLMPSLLDKAFKGEL